MVYYPKEKRALFFFFLKSILIILLKGDGGLEEIFLHFFPFSCALYDDEFSSVGPSIFLRIKVYLGCTRAFKSPPALCYNNHLDI